MNASREALQVLRDSARVDRAFARQAPAAGLGLATGPARSWTGVRRRTECARECTRTFDTPSLTHPCRGEVGPKRQPLGRGCARAAAQHARSCRRRDRPVLAQMWARGAAGTSTERMSRRRLKRSTSAPRPHLPLSLRLLRVLSGTTGGRARGRARPRGGECNGSGNLQLLQHSTHTRQPQP